MLGICQLLLPGFIVYFVKNMEKKKRGGTEHKCQWKSEDLRRFWQLANEVGIKLPAKVV